MNRTRGRFWALVGGVGAVVILITAVIWPSLLGHLRAAVLLDRLSGQRVIRLQRLISGPVSSSVVFIPSATQPIRAHLYRRVRASGRGGRGIVIVHGFSPVGDDYGDMAGAAENLAASGFVVMTPTIPPLTHYVVSEEAMRMIGDSAVWLAKETGAPVTVLGISFSGGLTLVSAVQPEYRDSFRQVIALSAYDDLRRIIVFYLTGKEARPDGKGVPAVLANPFAVEVTAVQFLDWLVPPEDVLPVRSVLQQSIMQRQTQSTPDPHLMSMLTPRQQREANDIIAAPDTLKLRLEDALSARRTDLGLLSPHGQLSSLNIPVTVISGLDDPAIPTLESKWLAQDLPKRTLCELHFSPLIRHVYLATHTRETGYARLVHWVNKLRLLNALAPAMETADPHALFPGCVVGQ